MDLYLMQYIGKNNLCKRLSGSFAIDSDALFMLYPFSKLLKIYKPINQLTNRLGL